MKKSLKLTRSRKGRKRTEEVSSSDKDSDASRDELVQNAEKAKKCNQSEAKTTKKRKFEPEKASVPSPPATKKRKKRNLTRSDSDLSNENQSGSNSSQDAQPNSSSVPSANSNDITQSSEFAQYLKVRIFV